MSSPSESIWTLKRVILLLIPVEYWCLYGKNKSLSIRVHWFAPGVTRTPLTNTADSAGLLGYCNPARAWSWMPEGQKPIPNQEIGRGVSHGRLISHHEIPWDTWPQTTTTSDNQAQQENRRRVPQHLEFISCPVLVFVVTCFKSALPADS